MMLYGYFKTNYEKEISKEASRELDPEEKPLLNNKDVLPPSEKAH